MVGFLSQGAPTIRLTDPGKDHTVQSREREVLHRDVLADLHHPCLSRVQIIEALDETPGGAVPPDLSLTLSVGSGLTGVGEPLGS